MTRISFQFLFIQNIYILFENEKGWDFLLYHLFILFSSICLNEAVAQLTDEQRWWRHRVRCCSNCRYVLACSQVCAWSTDWSKVRFITPENKPFFRFFVLTRKRKSRFQFVYSFFGSYWAKRIYHSISGFRRWAGPLIG